MEAVIAGSAAITSMLLLMARLGHLENLMGMPWFNKTNVIIHCLMTLMFMSLPWLVCGLGSMALQSMKL